jgi:hypothetical protein
MYARYVRNGGFFEPEYEAVTHAREREKRRHEEERHIINEPVNQLTKELLKKPRREKGLLESLGLDNGDVILIAVLFFLYRETGDMEMLLLLGLLFII